MTLMRQSVLNKLVYGAVSISLLSLCVFFAITAGYLAWLEVLPVIRQGKLSIETDSMILNILWEGNEIYILLLAYLLLAGGFAYGSARAFRAAVSSN